MRWNLMNTTQLENELDNQYLKLNDEDEIIYILYKRYAEEHPSYHTQ